MQLIHNLLIYRTSLQLCRELSPKPNFILLLGERYGWRPIPEVLYPEQMAMLWHNAAKDERKLLDRWYYLDENDARDPYGIFKLESRVGTGLDAVSFTNEVESKLLPLIRKYLPEFDLSATESEASHGFFGDDDTTDGHVFAYIRIFGEIPEDVRPTYIDVGEDSEYQSRFRSKTKEKLGEQYIYEENGLSWNDYNSPLFKKRFKDRLRAYLCSIIDKEVEDGNALTEIDYESFIQMDFARSEAETFYGRSADIECISRYIESGKEVRPLWVHGSSGLGKSALMAKITTMYVDRDGFIVVPVFCSQSKISSDSRRIMSYIRQLLGYKNDSTINQANNIHTYAYKLVSSINYLIIIDAIDQLDGNSYPEFNSLTWIADLNRLLPANVRVIISSTDDARFPLDTPQMEHLHLEPMKEDAEQILLHRLAWHNRRLTETQLKSVRRLISEEENSGLSLTLLAAILADIDSRTEIGHIPASTEWRCIYILERMIESGIYGKRLTLLVPALVAASSDGIDPSNLSRLLALDSELCAELSSDSFHQWDKSDSIPPIILSRLLYQLNKSVFRISTSSIGFTIKFRHNAIRRELTHNWIKYTVLESARELMRHLYSHEYLTGNMLALRDYVYSIVSGKYVDICHDINFSFIYGRTDSIPTIIKDTCRKAFGILHDILYDVRYISLKEKYYQRQIVREFDSFIRICNSAGLEKERADALIAKNFIVYTTLDAQTRRGYNTNTAESLTERQWLMLIYNTWDFHPLRIAFDKRFDSTMLLDLYRNIDMELYTVYSIDDCGDKPWLAPTGEVFFRLRTCDDGKRHLEKVNLKTGDVERAVLREPDSFIDYKISDDLSKIFIAHPDGIYIYDINLCNNDRERPNPDGFKARIDMKGIEWLDISPDGMYLAAGGTDVDTLYIDIASNTLMRWSKCHHAKLSSSGKVLWAFQYKPVSEDNCEIIIYRVDFITRKVYSFVYEDRLYAATNFQYFFGIECSDNIAVFSNIKYNIYVFNGEIRAWSYHKQAPIQYAKILPDGNKFLLFHVSGAFIEFNINENILSTVHQGNVHTTNQLTPDLKYGLTVNERRVYDFQALKKIFAIGQTWPAIAGLNSTSASVDGKISVISIGQNQTWETGEIRRPIITKLRDNGQYIEYLLDVNDSEYCYYVSASSISPDGRLLVYATFAYNKFIVYFYDFSKECIIASAPIRKQAKSIIFTNDSRWVIIVTGDFAYDVEAFIHIFDKTGNKISEIECEDYLTLTSKANIILSPDNRYLAYWSNEINIWDLIERKNICKYKVKYEKYKNHLLIFGSKTASLIDKIDDDLGLRAISQSGRFHFLKDNNESLYIRDTKTGNIRYIRDKVGIVEPTFDDYHFYISTYACEIELYDIEGRLLQQTIFHKKHGPLMMINTSSGLVVGCCDCHAALLQPDPSIGVDALPISIARRRWNLSNGKLGSYEVVCPMCGYVFSPSKNCPACDHKLRIEHTEKGLFRYLNTKNW